MSPHPSSLPRLMLRVLRHLLMVVAGVLGAKLAEVRARRDALPAGHFRRARMAAELRRLARLRRLIADPDLLADAAFRGKAAEVARVCNDAGRRAMVRRQLVAAPLVRLRGGVASRPVASMAEGRCTGGMVVALALPGGAPGRRCWCLYGVASRRAPTLPAALVSPGAQAREPGRGSSGGGAVARLDISAPGPRLIANRSRDDATCRNL